jgi:Uma2 family endonuclease
VGRVLAAGSVFWIIDPDFRTVGIHRPGQPILVLNEERTLDGESCLPGFRSRVRDLFGV